jgi:hypothetical protein
VASLLLCNSVKTRREVAARLVELAERARVLGDFGTVFAVVEGLSCKAAVALTCLWQRFADVFPHHALFLTDLQK